MRGHAAEMREVRLRLCRRMVEHARLGTTDVAPGVMFNDVAAYTDVQRHELELHKLFRGMPQVVCLSSDLPEPGSFRLFDDTGVPIVVVRSKDGVVRAFLNICPHRGARLVRQTEGRAQRLTCWFHGWTFDTQGHAAVVPQEKHFCNAHDEQKHLIPCPAAERHGLVFVKPVPNSTMDVDGHLGMFGRELALLDLHDARKVAEGELSVTCNWKYALDTYFENYHFATLHKNSIGLTSPNNLSVYDMWGPHHRLVFPTKDVWDWGQQPESKWPTETLSTPYFIFPNTIVYLGSLSPGHSYVTMFRLYPRGVGEMVTRVATYAPEGVSSHEHRVEVEAAFQAICNLVRNEDYLVTGESWRNFHFMPKGSRLVYGRQEPAVQHLHLWVARILGLPDPEIVPASSADTPERQATVACNS